MRLEIPVTANNEGAFETLDEDGSVLQDEEVSLGEALINPEVDAEHIYPTFAQASNPRRMKPMSEAVRNGIGADSSDADALLGENAKPSRAMELRSAMGKRDGRAPAQATSLTLGGPERIVRDDLGFLSKQDIGP